MKNLDRFILFAIILTITFFIGTFVVYGQETQRIIQVSGTSEYNLSPDEIVISISFEEFFTDENEQASSKIKIEDLQQQVFKVLKAAKIEDKDITSGSVTLVRPRIRNTFKKRRLNQTLLICIKNTTEYIALVREIENAGLFEKVVTDFRIVEYRNTNKEEYLIKSRAKAYANAVEKAELILSHSGEKIGKVLSISEMKENNLNNGGFYEMANSNNISGFKPIVISYHLQVVFEIR